MHQRWWHGDGQRQTELQEQPEHQPPVGGGFGLAVLSLCCAPGVRSDTSLSRRTAACTWSLLSHLSGSLSVERDEVVIDLAKTLSHSAGSCRASVALGECGLEGLDAGVGSGELAAVHEGALDDDETGSAVGLGLGPLLLGEGPERTAGDALAGGSVEDGAGLGVVAAYAVEESAEVLEAGACTHTVGGDTGAGLSLSEVAGAEDLEGEKGDEEESAHRENLSCGSECH